MGYPVGAPRVAVYRASEVPAGGEKGMFRSEYVPTNLRKIRLVEMIGDHPGGEGA